MAEEVEPPQPKPQEEIKPQPKREAMPEPKTEVIESKPLAKPKAKPAPQKSSPKKKSAAPQKQKQIVRKSAPKPATPAKKAAVSAAKTKTQQTKQQALLAQAQESIAKIRGGRATIDANQNAPRADLQIPQLTLTAMATDDTAGWSAQELSYRDELAGRLKLQLKLPEYGGVKLKLTLLRSGQVAKVKIVEAGSQRNRSYVENQLPTLLFPPFGTHFGQEPEYTFAITLNNDF